ncbi:MAG: hypothetical protein AABX84_00490 [Nanoarchaeota archaeon]
MLRLDKILTYFLIPTSFFLFHMFLDLVFDIYTKFPWFGNIMHFSGGIVLGFTFFPLLNYLNEEKYLKLDKIMKFIFVLSLVGLFAIFWEFYEFTMVNVFSVNWQMTYGDTIIDLFLGLIGGIIASAIFLWKKY